MHGIFHLEFYGRYADFTFKKKMKYLSISCHIVFKPSDFPLHFSLKPFQTPFYFICNDFAGGVAVG